MAKFRHEVYKLIKSEDENGSIDDKEKQRKNFEALKNKKPEFMK